jgi:hypothetical protein
VRTPPGQSNRVVIQGRRERVDRFEPSLVFAQLFDSPWSAGDKLVLAGGWGGFATPATRRLLTHPDSVGKLPGDLGALDAHGRGVAYESLKVSSDSFAERVRRQMPPGLNVEQTRQRLDDEVTRTEASARLNRRLLWLCGGLVALLAGARLMMTLPHRDRESAPDATAAS